MPTSEPAVPWSVTVVVVAVAAVLMPWTVAVVYRGGRRLGWSTHRSRALAGRVALALTVWGGLAVVLTAAGAFADDPDRPPWLLFWTLGVIAVATVGALRWAALSEVLSNRQTMAELLLCQTARWLGAVFLALEVGDDLPGFFAYPAGFGDILVGISAPVAVLALIYSRSNRIPLAWTCLGLLDFAGALGTAFLATRTFAVVRTDPPTSLFAELPMALFPAYMVSFSLVLHLVTLRLLLRPRLPGVDGGVLPSAAGAPGCTFSATGNSSLRAD